MDIKENEKLITEFMGGRFLACRVQFMDSKYMPFVEANAHKFHEKWDWTIHVLRKIEEEHDYISRLETVGVGVYEFTLCKFKIPSYEPTLPEGLFVRTDARACNLKDAKLGAVYRGCVEFIKWHNQQKEG